MHIVQRSNGMPDSEIEACRFRSDSEMRFPVNFLHKSKSLLNQFNRLVYQHLGDLSDDNARQRKGSELQAPNAFEKKSFSFSPTKAAFQFGLLDICSFQNFKL